MALAGPQRKVKSMIAGLIVNFQQQFVFAGLQIEDDHGAIGGDAACHILREQFLGVEPDLQSIIAAQTHGCLRRLVGGERAKQIGRDPAVCRQGLRLTIGPLRTRRPQGFTGGAFGC